MTNVASQTSDYKWFTDNYASLCEKYGNAFVAIKNESILGAYSSFAAGVKETLKHEPVGSFIVQKCYADGHMHIDSIASMNFM